MPLRLLLYTILFAFLSTTSAADSSPARRVLVIHSYHPEFHRVQKISEIVNEQLGQNFDIVHEHLSTIQFDAEMMYEVANESLRRKLKTSSSPEIVLTFDDDALIFAERYRDRLFPDVPIVFAGVNSRKLVLEMVEKPKITGVFEEFWMAENVDLARELNPTPLRRLVALGGDTRLSRALLEQVRDRVALDHRITLETIDASTMTYEEALQRIEDLRDPGSAIMYAAPLRDKTGASFIAKGGIGPIEARASRPIYAFADTIIEDGATAGYAVSTRATANASMELAKRVLAGESADAIPPVLESPNQLIVDEPRARRFGLMIDRLGDRAQILRPVPSFWVRNAQALVAGAAVLAAMAVVMLAILIANRRVRHGLLAMNQTLTEQNSMLADANRRIEYQSLHDALTGLANRRYLEQKLSEVVNDKELRKTLTLVHIDLDRFKQINDTLGHLAGDEVLRATAEFLTKNVPDSAFVARIGGDEFVVLAQFESRQSAECFSATLAQILSRNVKIDGVVTRLSASIGVATIDPQATIDDRELQRQADVALYLAKIGGRGRSAVFHPEHDVAYREQKQLADDIVRGLEAGEFVPFFQPQFSARTGDVVGVEALARWRHPERGLLSPFAFLSVAENIGVVADLDRVMLEKSALYVEQWRAAGVQLPQLSVNVSARRLLDGDLRETVSHLDFRETALCFELVESIFLDNADEDLDHAIDLLQDLGVRIEIDDFGTGHASIVGVRRLRPHRLKIARELTARIDQDVQQKQLAQAIVQIGRSLDIQLTAEGVETEEQASILRDLGCDVFQGFLYSKPIPADEIVAFVERHKTESNAA